MPPQPFVSVVIPCRDEVRRIRAVLDSLRSCDYPKDRLEVLFVDGMSADGTREILDAAAAALPFVRVLENPGLTAPRAMNVGARAARGEVIVRMDGHAEFPADYVSRCVALLLSSPRIGSAGGRPIHLPGGDGPWARAVTFVTTHRLGVGHVPYVMDREPGSVDTVPFGTFRASVLRQVGLFDERLTRNQDNELHARLRKAGYEIAFDPAIVCRYRGRADLRGLMRQGYFNGVWNAYTLRLCPYTWKTRRFVPTAFVLYLAALAGALALHWRRAPAAAAPLALYAVLVGGASAAPGARGAGAWRAALTFAGYHLAYGLGPLVGAANIATGRWRRHLGAPLPRPKPGPIDWLAGLLQDPAS